MSVTWQCGHLYINEAKFPFSTQKHRETGWIVWLEQPGIYPINMLISTNQSGHTYEKYPPLLFPTLSPFLGRHRHTLADGHVSIYCFFGWFSLHWAVWDPCLLSLKPLVVNVACIFLLEISRPVFGGSSPRFLSFSLHLVGGFNHLEKD